MGHKTNVLRLKHSCSNAPATISQAAFHFFDKRSAPVARKLVQLRNQALQKFVTIIHRLRKPSCYGDTSEIQTAFGGSSPHPHLKGGEMQAALAAKRKHQTTRETSLRLAFLDQTEAVMIVANRYGIPRTGRRKHIIWKTRPGTAT